MALKTRVTTHVLPALNHQRCIIHWISSAALKFQVSFAEYSLFYRALLQKILSFAEYDPLHVIQYNTPDDQHSGIGWYAVDNIQRMIKFAAKEPYKRDCILQKRPKFSSTAYHPIPECCPDDIQRWYSAVIFSGWMSHVICIYVWHTSLAKQVPNKWHDMQGTYVWVVSQMRMGHVTCLAHCLSSNTTLRMISGWYSVVIFSGDIQRVNESCHMHLRVAHIAHACVSNEAALSLLLICKSFICVPRLIHMCAMTHSYVCHDSRLHSLFSLYATPSYVCHDSFICVPWLIHMCDMTHSYVWQGSFIYVWHVTHAWESAASLWHVTHATSLMHAWLLSSESWVMCVWVVSHESRACEKRVMGHVCVCSESWVMCVWEASHESCVCV